MRTPGSSRFLACSARCLSASAALAILTAHAAIAQPLFPGPAYPVVVQPGSNAVGDFNGDGRLDVVVAGSGVSVLLGQGDGTLGLEVPIDPTSGIIQVGVGDFDADGFDDVAYTDGRNGIVLILSLGDGSFASPVTIGTVNSAKRLAVSDFDVNGADDLALRSDDIGEVTILLARGDGTFDPEQRYPICICAGFTSSIAVADFNLDGLPDLALGGQDFQVLLNLGAGTFGPSTLIVVNTFTHGVVTGDFNGDGAPDLIGEDYWDLTSGGFLVPGNGDGTFEVPVAVPPTIPEEVRAAGDVNGDGLMDLIGALGSAVVGLGRSDTTIEALEPFELGPRTTMSLGDFDGNGCLDLLVGVTDDFTSSSEVAVLAGRGDGTFGAPPSLPAGDFPARSAAGDLDDDQNLDFVTSNRDSDDISVFLNRGDGSFDPQARYAAGATPRDIVVGEFNGDQWGDVAVLNRDTNQITVLLGQGSGVLGAGTGFGILGGSRSLALGDFDGDDAQDLAIVGGSPAVIQILYGTGSGTFASPVLVDPFPCSPGGAGFIMVTDLDADSHDDFLISDGSIDDCLMRGRGDGTFETPTGIGGAASTLGFAVADFNDDGVPDYAATGYHEWNAVVYIGTGGGAFGPGTRYPLGAYGYRPMAGDFDADGRIDFAMLRGSDTGDFAVLRGEGDGTFGMVQSFVPGVSPADLVPGDFDGDGADDLVMPEVNQDRVRVLISAGGNRPPAAVAAGPPGTVCAPPGGALVQLDGSASGDPDSTPGTNDDIVQFDWFEDFGLPAEVLLGSGEILAVTLPVGLHSITLRVTDSASATDTDLLMVDVVIDTTPPSISVGLSPALLWPPNHRLVDVEAIVTASDLCGPVTVVLESIGSDEPDDAPGSGDGRTVNDIQGAEIGTADFLFRLRAERAATGEGRTYNAVYRAIDGAGLTATAAGTAFVPHDIGGIMEPMMLSVYKNGAGTVVGWLSVPGALSYGVVRGSVGNITENQEYILLGTLTCVAAPTSQTNTEGSEDAATPALGTAFFYLAVYDDGLSSGYGTESAGKDRFVPPGLGSCP